MLQMKQNKCNIWTKAGFGISISSVSQIHNQTWTNSIDNVKDDWRKKNIKLAQIAKSIQ